MTYDAYQRPAFLAHAASFKGAPEGFARCRRCGTFFTDDQWATEACLGGAETRPLPRPTGPAACRLCGALLEVEPRHRAVVELFGSICDGCAGMVAEIGADPQPKEAAA